MIRTCSKKVCSFVEIQENPFCSIYLLSAFYCIVALAIVRYLGAQLTEYHWNAFKSSAPQAATENAMFFMRLAIQRSPAGHHMSMEGTLDELLIKGELP